MRPIDSSEGVTIVIQLYAVWYVEGFAVSFLRHMTAASTLLFIQVKDEYWSMRDCGLWNNERVTDSCFKSFLGSCVVEGEVALWKKTDNTRGQLSNYVASPAFLRLVRLTGDRDLVFRL